MALVGSGAYLDGNVDGKLVAVTIVVAGVADVEIDVLMLDGIWFEWLLELICMYSLFLPLSYFEWPSVILCHNLLNWLLVFLIYFYV